MDDRAVDRLLRSALDADAADAGPHPEPDALFDYHAGELSAAEADHVQAHLALCPRCARAVADFEAFPHLDPPAEDDVPSEAEMEAGWAQVRAKLDAAPAAVDSGETMVAGHAADAGPRPPAEVVPLAPRPSARLPVLRRPVPAYALAATFVGALGLSWIVSLTGSLAPHHGPSANPALLTLMPEDALTTREVGPEFPQFVIRRRAALVTIAINSLATPDSGPYAVEVRDGHDESRLVKRVDGLVTDAKGVVAFTAPRDWLPSGRYYARLVDARTREQVADYRFEIVLE